MQGRTVAAAPSRPAAATAAALLLLVLLLQRVAGLGNESNASAAPITPSAPAAPIVPSATVVATAPTAPPATIAPVASSAPVAPSAPSENALFAHARRHNKDRSTSSSSGERKKDSESSSGDNKKESLDMNSMSDLTSRDTDKGKGKTKGKSKGKYVPKSSSERRGWRKWHRKCTPCPEQSKKWRDPTILWICGGYQRARRSFKSACMMRYRNCQDGTMFVKLYNHRCKPDLPGEPRPHGEDFFYTYHVRLSGDSSTNHDKSSKSAQSASSQSSDAQRRFMDWRPEFPAAPAAPALPLAAALQTVGINNVTQNITKTK